MQTLPGLVRAIENDEALHYVNSPKHGAAILRQLAGVVSQVIQNGDDDPALFAYQIREALPQIVGLLIDVRVWADKVIAAGPDDIPESGAQLCS